MISALGVLLTTFTSTLKSGQVAIVNWSIDGEVTELVDFALMDGTSSFDNAVKVADVLMGASPQALSFEWTVPMVPSGSKYFIRVGSGSDYRYSGAFSIEGSSEQSTPPPTTSTSPTTATTSTPKQSTDNSKNDSTQTINEPTDPNRRLVGSAEKHGASILYFVISFLYL